MQHHSKHHNMVSCMSINYDKGSNGKAEIKQIKNIQFSLFLINGATKIYSHFIFYTSRY
ncbi:hypothetical protein DOY81_001972 [Sarcophaga bullata]|nr:hypothetical protein DOY81_001972 [Sarcophaga bullata]